MVSIVKGENRKENVRRSLALIAEDVKWGIGDRQIVIKPNFVSTSIHLASSHVDQIRGILDFLRDFYKKRIIIAEAACGNTLEAFKNFGYHILIHEYDVELIDLNQGPYELITLKGSNESAITLRVSSLLLNKNNYRISAAKLKTHDTVVVTLSIKNMAMGSVLLSGKRKVHQGLKQIHLHIAALAQRAWPDLSVIDGLVGMEGDGPIHGTPLHAGIAIAGTDPLAVDRMACEIMGVDFSKVGYLHYCMEKGLGEGDIERIHVVGESLKECITPFRLHRRVEDQYKWRIQA